ncbi:MAG: hypothetical protein LBE57_01830, partial [Methanosarcinales archaeon]|nr:hypothetical protein [Methanosarcinales archaeon]
MFIPKELYEYYKSKPRLENIGNYALSDLDRLLLRQMIESFKEHGRKNGYTDDEIVMNVITFVQSLPYTFDIDTTGYDDYPRFPLETLVDGGGDCEDSAVLAAALLFEMGCDVILIELPNHMAMGIKINDEIQGTFWEYNEERYYYIETTYPDWNIGEVPPGYQNLSARLHPMIPIPQIHVSIQANYDRHDLNYVYYNVRCDIINYGPTTAKNISACIMAEFHPFDFNKAGSQGNEIFVGDIPEGGTRAAEAAVRIPRREVARFSCIVSGDNFDPANAETNIISVC